MRPPTTTIQISAYGSPAHELRLASRLVVGDAHHGGGQHAQGQPGCGGGGFQDQAVART